MKKGIKAEGITPRSEDSVKSFLEKDSNIFYIFGLSCAGKDTLYNEIIKDKEFLEKAKLDEVVMHTNRPKRQGEVDKETYYFTSLSDMRNLLENGELATYTEYTVADGSIYAYGLHRSYIENAVAQKRNIIVGSGSKEGLKDIIVSIKRNNFPINVIPIFLFADPYTLLSRAINRQKDAISNVEDPEDWERAAEIGRRIKSDYIDYYKYYIYNSIYDIKAKFGFIGYFRLNTANSVFARSPEKAIMNDANAIKRYIMSCLRLHMVVE